MHNQTVVDWANFAAPPFLFSYLSELMVSLQFSLDVSQWDQQIVVLHWCLLTCQNNSRIYREFKCKGWITEAPTVKDQSANYACVHAWNFTVIKTLESGTVHAQSFISCVQTQILSQTFMNVAQESVCCFPFL